MAEYIEREAVIATIAKHMASVNEHCYSVNHSKEQYDIYAMATNHAIDYVRCVPAADVVPVVHGEWEEYPDRSHLRCTNCKIEFERIKMPSTRHYCPNCGADMRERKGDDD